ncbi:MAG: 2-C-methyl-D-erythritol 4-phosphate cytidylyltransferase [Desulfovibrionales bacterium]
MHTWAIVLAAGNSTRLCANGIQEKKQFIEYHNQPVYWKSIATLANIPFIHGIILAFPDKDFLTRCSEADKLHKKNAPRLNLLYARGGKERQDSVYNALRVLPDNCSHVLVHDAARPFFSPALVSSLLKNFSPENDAIIPVLPCKDTIKTLCGNMVEKTLPRKNLCSVQTPQFFSKKILFKAHEEARKNQFLGTDDASLVEQIGGKIKTVFGEENNLKLTTAADIKHLKSIRKPRMSHISGFGYDVHKFGGSKPMILGGIPIPNGPAIEAHSDGDVLMHALTDAILGTLGMGDIGDYFPDSDPHNEGKSSSIFVAEALHLAEKKRLILTHIDLTIITQIPRLTEYKPLIKKNILGITGLAEDQINVKATTEEGLGFTGKKEGIKAVALVTAKKAEEKDDLI